MPSTIRLNNKNSKIMNGKVFITALKANNIGPKLEKFLNSSSKINHPNLGILIEYNGPYTRKVKEVK
jgi:hypothetical protein